MTGMTAIVKSSSAASAAFTTFDFETLFILFLLEKKYPGMEREVSAFPGGFRNLSGLFGNVPKKIVYSPLSRLVKKKNENL